jgi:hypothetical protein
MRIQIDVSVFSSPTTAFGKASGAIEVERLPKAHEVFAWPSSWVAARPSYFSQEQSLVQSVNEMGTEPLVMLYGIVCDSVATARDCATFLEQKGGLFFDEYEHPVPGHKA